MDYSKFVNAIKAQDERNIIKKMNRMVSNIPKPLVEFFNLYEPEDVEIVMKDLTALKLYPFDYLNVLQSEYSIGNEYFIFATKNSDPIAIYKQHIVTLVHGSKSTETEKLANSFEEYVCELMDNMKA